MVREDGGGGAGRPIVKRGGEDGSERRDSDAGDGENRTNGHHGKIVYSGTYHLKTVSTPN